MVIFSYRIPRPDTADSIESRIARRVEKRGRGAVFIPTDFLDLGSRQAIDLALHRLVKKGTLRRFARALYEYPKNTPRSALSRAGRGGHRQSARREAQDPPPAFGGLRREHAAAVRADSGEGGVSHRRADPQGAHPESEDELRRTTPRAMAAAGTTAS